jgi:O-antigen biosynthesis protein
MINRKKSRPPEPAKVSLELDQERVALIDGRTVARSLPVWLRVSPTAAFPGRRWVRVRYRSSFFDDVARPLIRFDTADGRILVEPMNGSILGTGEWTGWVPDKTLSVSINPVDRLGPFVFAIENVEILAHWRLLRRTAVFETSRLTAAVLERLFDWPDEELRGLKLAVTVTPFEDYHDWHSRLVRRTDPQGIDWPRADWRSTPDFILLLCLAGAGNDELNTTIQSLKSQVYSRWWLCAILDGADIAAVEAYRNAARNDRRLFEVEGERPLTGLPGLKPDDRLSIIAPGDTLPDYSLAVVAEALAREPDLALVYGDEDAITRDGTLHSPVFKPDWSPVLQRALSYIGRFTCVRGGDLIGSGCKSVCDLVSDEETGLGRVLDAIGWKNVRHIRRVLYRRRLGRKELSAGVRDRLPVRSSRVVGGDRNWPEVTIVIPTRDLADLLSECVKGLKEKTEYPHYRVVIIDNGSTEPDALALLSDLRRMRDFTVVDRPGPFNFSALSNEGARLTATPFLVFLNNDIEMIDSDWLKPLIRWAEQPQIGAVGAKLLFPGGTIQHAGVVVGLGGIGGHMYRKQRSDAPGYLGELKVPHEVTAVTAACIAIERAKFEAVGGFDSENLPVELNDLDLCLRLAEHGWSNLWTPESVLYHHESASRLVGLSPSKAYRGERIYFTRRWQHIIRDDPHFHPGLSLFSFQPALA